jgi:AraC family transcriptional regulator
MKTETRTFYAAAVQRIIEMIAGRLDEALDLETLAREASLSPFHFHRVFRGMVGETPTELARRLRLERAAWRLARTDRAVTEIALEAGYETHEAFTRAFRSHYDASPSTFRFRKHPRIELAAPCGVHYDHEGTIRPFVPRDSGGQHMQVEIKQVPDLRLGTVRHIGPYNQIPVAFERLGQILGQAAADLFRQRGSEMIAIYHDDPESVPVDLLRSDAAIVVPPDVALPAGLVEQRIPGGRYACAIHVGPYEQLGDTWARFMGEWLPRSGHRIADGPCYEVYLNDPTTTPKPELRTEMRIPLA